MGFIDIRMPERICKEFSGGPTYANTIVRARGGYRQANVDRPDVLFKFEAGAFLKDSNLRLQLMAFFMALRGDAHTFRFRDIGHYWTGCQLPGVGDITPLAPAAIEPFATGDGVTVAFQLRVPYTFGSFTTWRTITKPCKVNDDNPGYTGPRFWWGTTPKTSGFTLDYDTGIVTFSTAPANGTAIRWAGLFDVHASFMDGELVLALLESPEAAEMKIRVMEELGTGL
jgi:uncharacterized protein (TIGR02217 family)